MARRVRYKEIEQLLTRVLIADAVVFALYLLFAGLGVTALKVITAIIAILGSGLCLGFLYMSGEIKKRRSRWIVVGFGAIIVCVLFSLILSYPSPAAKDAATPASSTISTVSTEATGSTDAAEATDAVEATDTTGATGGTT